MAVIALGSGERTHFMFYLLKSRDTRRYTYTYVVSSGDAFWSSSHRSFHSKIPNWNEPNDSACSTTYNYVESYALGFYSVTLRLPHGLDSTTDTSWLAELSPRTRMTQYMS
jgi:hypothetical protein